MTLGVSGSSDADSASFSHPGRSQTDVVVGGIKLMLTSGQLAPGDKLPVEKDLATLLGVSRSSLREGVRALSIMGVLDSRQGAGTYVTSLDPSLLLAPMGFVVDLQHSADAIHLHAVRRVLETEAAGRASLLISDEELTQVAAALERGDRAIEAEVVDHDEVLAADVAFHRIIGGASQNPVLASLIEALSTNTVRGRLWRAITDVHAERNTQAEHRAILKALASGDPDRARSAMSSHLIAVEDFLRDQPIRETKAGDHDERQ